MNHFDTATAHIGTKYNHSGGGGGQKQTKTSGEKKYGSANSVSLQLLCYASE